MKIKNDLNRFWILGLKKKDIKNSFEDERVKKIFNHLKKKVIERKKDRQYIG